MQLSYDNEPPIGYEGQLFSAYPHAMLSGLAQAAALSPGRVVVMDKTSGYEDKAARAIVATGDVTTLAGVLGVVLWDPTYPFQSGDGAAGVATYAQGKIVPIVRKGRILMYSETALAKGVNPFVRFDASSTALGIGQLRNDVDHVSSADHAVAAPYLTTITGTTAAGLVVVEINL